MPDDTLNQYIKSKNAEMTFVTSLHRALAEMTKEIAEDELVKTQARIEQRVREKVGAVVIRIAQTAEVQMRGDRLIVEVRMPEVKEKGETHV
jgi:hypothetical protein